MRIFRHPSGLEQRLAVADLTRGGDRTLGELVRVDHPGGRPVIVYSDPPWNPGNEKYWRRFAKAEPPTSYDVLLDAWCRAAAACSPDHVFVEQSVNPAHLVLFHAAVERAPNWLLPLIEQWTVFYGSPRRPNALLHYGWDEVATDPGAMAGEAMTRTVLDGLTGLAGGLLVDPCMGTGMTSRQAHAHGMHAAGTELNQARLDKTIAWLERHGYDELA